MALITIAVLALLGVGGTASVASSTALAADPAACPAETAACAVEEDAASAEGSTAEQGAEAGSANGQPSAATTDTINATVVGSLEFELESLRRAFSSWGANDPAFADWLSRLMTCASAEVARAPAGPLSPLQARSTVIGLLTACMSTRGVTLPSGGLEGSVGLGGSGKDGGGHGVACANAAGDPRLGKDGSWGTGYHDYTAEEKKQIKEQWQREYDLAHEEGVRTLREAEKAWKEYGNLQPDDPRTDVVKAHLEQTLKEFDEATQKEEKARIKKDSEPVKSANVSLTARDAEDFCAGAAELIAECERNDWSTYDCQRLKNATGCGSDPAVTDPTPVSEESDAQPAKATCQPTQPSEEEAGGVALLACEALVNTGPDGGSPCVLSVLDPAQNTPFGFNLQYCMGQVGTDSWICAVIDPCSNENAQPGEEAENCFGEATVFSIRPDAAVVIAVAHAKLGGPIWIPPTPRPSPGGPEPEPMP
jgi:hypothetical protein